VVRIIIFILFAFLQSCRTSSVCKLRLLSNDELFEKATKAIFIPKNALYYLETGEVIHTDSLVNYDRNKYALSQYVNCKDSIVKLVIRPLKKEDILLRNKIDSLYSNNIELAVQRVKFIENDTLIQREMIELILFDQPQKFSDVDCDSIFQLISAAFLRDQNNRNEINLIIDRQNSNLFESIVNKCGFEAIESLGEESVYKSFMIVQHGPARIRKDYLEKFKSTSNRGLLGKNVLALMIDRTLVDQKKQQLYGTQYNINKINGEIEFYPIFEPEKLNLRRKEMNLSSFEVYKNQILKNDINIK
jgi:hypothetical protein